MGKTGKKIIISLIALITLTLNPETSFALDNTYVISDFNFSGSNPMSVTEINDFLIAKGSRLANFTIPEYVDVPYPLAAGGLTSVSSRQINDLNGAPFYGKTVAQLIYDECTEHNVNPRVVLATLQKESSAITGDVFRSTTVGAWPMFYMYDETMASCLNSGINCNDSVYRETSLNYGGMGRQLGYSIAWFGKKYYDYTHGGRCLPSSSTCTSHEQYYDPVTIDGQTIVSQTAGTRILYLYTPHIQTSFYNIFSTFFGDPAINGSVEARDDTVDLNYKIYTSAIRISGSKALTSRVHMGDSIIADLNSTTWVINTEPPVGSSTILLIYRDEAGTEVNRKTIQITKHKTADINGDGAVDLTDLSLLAAAWGQKNPSDLFLDLNADSNVDIIDLSILASNWGG